MSWRNPLTFIFTPFWTPINSSAELESMRISSSPTTIKQMKPIGMGTISAGMKQLAATSLLWALKEVSGRQLPVVIDTPLARIDLRHQHNLLTRYYPEAGDQVIMLPTDSELDEVKRKLLLPHVYKAFELYNPTGEKTEIREETLG